MHDHVQPAAVAHAHNQVHGPALTGGFKNFIDQRDQGGHAFQRKTLVAEIALLQYLLEQISPDELVQYVFLIDCRLRTFQAFLDPAASYRVGDVHELSADCSAINPASLLGQFAIRAQLRMGHRRQKAEWIEVGFQISPVPERVEDALTVAVGSFQHASRGSFNRSFRSGRHISTTRITDDAGCVLDSAPVGTKQPLSNYALSRAVFGKAFISKPFNSIVMTEAARVA